MIIQPSALSEATTAALLQPCARVGSRVALSLLSVNHGGIILLRIGCKLSITVTPSRVVLDDVTR